MEPVARRHAQPPLRSGGSRPVRVIPRYTVPRQPPGPASGQGPLRAGLRPTPFATLVREYPTSRPFAEASIDTLACLHLDTAAESARSSHIRSSRRRGCLWAATTGPPTARRSSSPARTWLSCVSEQQARDGDRDVRRHPLGRVAAEHHRQHQRYHRRSNPRGCRRPWATTVGRRPRFLRGSRRRDKQVGPPSPQALPPVSSSRVPKNVR
jgi:hypothetical protein